MGTLPNNLETAELLQVYHLDQCRYLPIIIAGLFGDFVV